MPGDSLSFEKQARRSGMIYSVLAVSSIFAITALSIKPEVHCLEYDCPVWLRGLLFGFASFLVLGAVLALVRNSVWGSRVDRQTRRLIWWAGVPPCQEQEIDIDQIAVVRVETSGDTNRLVLRDKSGEPVFIDPFCLRPPYLDWAKAFVREFPHVRLETD
jgi:hypothetical protein